MSASVSLTFPDGSIRDYAAGTTGAEVAESISKSLAKKAVAIALDGTLRDLSDPIVEGKIEIVTRTDPRALELHRHIAEPIIGMRRDEIAPHPVAHLDLLIGEIEARAVRERIADRRHHFVVEHVALGPTEIADRPRAGGHRQQHQYRDCS